MTDASVFVISEALPPLGHVVRLHLSFPRMLRPLVVDATVDQIRMGGGPGSPPGFVAKFIVGDDERLRLRINEVARRLRPVKGALADRELSVLLVEDNQLIRDTFSYAFERYFRQRSAKIRLAQAATSKDAWSLVRPDTDLLLVDHKLVGEPGTDFISRLRSDGELGRCFIVGMSGGGRTARVAMLDAGADLFLDKPIIMRDLFETLDKLAAGGGLT